eukprot:1435859-Amphidinium_carterae.1
MPGLHSQSLLLKSACSEESGSGAAFHCSFVSLSLGSHVRTAGTQADPRKALLCGLLLCAALEWPWLMVTQLDASQEASLDRVADAAVAQMFAPTGTRELL